MARQFRLWENGHVVSLLPPAADSAGRTSAYVSLLNAHKAYIVCEVNQGNAAQVTFTPLQAQDTSGTNSKGLTQVAPIVANLNTSASDTLSVATSAASYQTDVGTNNKIVIFEIEPQEVMDLNSQTVNASGIPQPFNHIAIQTSASNAANITNARLIQIPLRFAQQLPPSANV